jgi:hypothetical protein
LSESHFPAPIHVPRQAAILKEKKKKLTSRQHFTSAGFNAATHSSASIPIWLLHPFLLYLLSSTFDLLFSLLHRFYRIFEEQIKFGMFMG